MGGEIWVISVGGSCKWVLYFSVAIHICDIYYITFIRGKVCSPCYYLLLFLKMITKEKFPDKITFMC